MKKVIVIAVLMWVSAVYALPSFNMDYATFRAGGGIFLQVYTMLQRNSLNFTTSDSLLTAKYSLVVEIMRDDSCLASWTLDRTTIASTAEEITSSQKIPDEASFGIFPGKYELVVSIQDLNSGEIRRREKEIEIADFPGDKLALSSIEFASRIERTDKSGQFIKRQLLVIPNADRVFGEDLMTAYYYLEIYNLCLDEPDKKYKIIRALLDQNRQEVKILPEKEQAQNASSVVEADFFSCATLHTGTYYLCITVVDGCTGDTTKTEKSFWVYKEGEEIQPEQVITLGRLESIIENLSEDETKREMEYIRYISTNQENKLMKELITGGYKNFLQNFWRSRDTTGEMRYRYVTRVMMVNEKYTTPMREGWKSDRGRAYILYGEPDLIERKNFELAGGDSEIWHYDQIEGGVLFIFYDLKGTGDLQQVYSTKRGEFVDAGWVKEMEERYYGQGLLQSLGIR